MEGGENHAPPRFCIEVNVPRGGRKLAILWLHHGYTLQSDVEAIVDLHCKIMCFNQLYLVYFLSYKRIIFVCFTEEDSPPLPSLKTLHLCHCML